MSPGAPLGPHGGRHPLHERTRARDEVGPRRIDDEPLAERGQPRDEVEGVEAEPGWPLPDDGGVDRDGAVDGHGDDYNRRMTVSGTSVSRAPRFGSAVGPWCLLGALVLGLCVVVAIWTSIDRRPPEWDHANHLGRALQCYRILAQPGHDRAREILEATAFYPPVTTCAAGLLYFVFPVTPLTAQVVMLGFLALGAVSVFLLGRRLLDTGAGLLAAFLLSTASFVIFSLTNFQLDLPLTGMVAFSLYLLMRTEGFSRTGWSLALGIAGGIGMLTKPPFVVYLLPPLLWVVWQAVRHPQEGGRTARLGRLTAALVAATALALPWYGPRLVGLPLQVMNRSFKNAALEQQPGRFSLEGLLHYPTMFPTEFGLLAVALFLWGLWALRRERAARAFLWIAALGPFVVFMLIQNKNLRYTLPILPAAALVAAAGARALRPALRHGVTWACVALGVLQVSMTAFALPAPPPSPGSVFRWCSSGGPSRRTGSRRESSATSSARVATNR